MAGEKLSELTELTSITQSIVDDGLFVYLAYTGISAKLNWNTMVASETDMFTETNDFLMVTPAKLVYYLTKVLYFPVTALSNADITLYTYQGVVISWEASTSQVKVTNTTGNDILITHNSDWIIGETPFKTIGSTVSLGNNASAYFSTNNSTLIDTDKNMVLGGDSFIPNGLTIYRKDSNGAIVGTDNASNFYVNRVTSTENTPQAYITYNFIIASTISNSSVIISPKGIINEINQS